METAPAPKFVRKARKILGLTQSELAEFLGLERHSIVRFEHRKSPGALPAQTRLAIEQLLHVHHEKTKA
jgi:transcriptional regulator with XRE-family HTH domain